ncbi:hypothetical protein V2J09_008676 [Rumex salicifolius]
MGKQLVVTVSAVLVLAGLTTTYFIVAYYRGCDHPKTPSHGGGRTTTTMTTKRSIESVCQPTTYRKTCVSSPKGAAGNTTDPKELVKVGFQLAKQAVLDVVSKSSIVKASKDDPRFAQALEICRELNNINNLNQFTENLKVWLGSATTFQDVSFDAFKNATDLTPATTLHRLFNSSRHLTSNSLTMIDELRMALSLLNLSSTASLSRLLLLRARPPQVGLLPAWINDAKRHILNQLVAALKPNAVVALDGTARFKTIKKALATVPAKNIKPFILYVKAGVYKEHVSVQVAMKNVVIIRDGATKTVITGNINFVDGTQTYNTTLLLWEKVS